MDDWILPSLLYLAAIVHHVLAIRAARRSDDQFSLLQRQLVLYREALALVEYGAMNEAEAALDEAIALGESRPK